MTDAARHRYRSALRLARTARQLGLHAAHDLRDGLLANALPKKPRTINFLANDICNSRCQMCFIWEKKQTFEVSPAELRTLLKDPLFSEVEHVGVTGGEPTLRADLPELVSAFIESCRTLRSVSIITNAIRTRQVLDRTLRCAEVCKAAGIDFSAMVSLDGLGEVHDLVRGRRGNFESAIACLETLHGKGIATTFGCTVTKDNAEHVDDLLDYAIAKGLYGRFRIAEFIDRLYNNEQRDKIRNFDDLKRYHLQLFFFRLKNGFEPQAHHRSTYTNIIGMLGGRSRSVPCPYQSDAVVLSSRAELHYCAPKGPSLGSVLEPGEASRAYRRNLPVRQQIRTQHCSQCIHDYHANETAHSLWTAALARRRHGSTYGLEGLRKRASALLSRGLPAAPRETGRHVLIVGWYGTETVGDKAILASIVENLRKRAEPPSRITVSSLYPFVTERTKVEVALPEVEIVETYSRGFETAVRDADEVVMGGGPLMDLECLDHVLFAFHAVRERGGSATVWGCGIGPLREPRYIAAVNAILGLATQVRLRDSASVERARREFGCVAEQVDDPAVAFVVRWRQQGASAPHGNVDVACFLRSWPHEYASGLTQAEHQELAARIEAAFAARIAAWCAQGLRVGLYPMHSFDIGGDDRVFNRRLARAVLETGCDSRLLICRRMPASPTDILSAIAGARLSLCMRFHSVVFAQTLGRPYLAIDYTQGGKIRAFLEDVGHVQRLRSLDDVLNGNWPDFFDESASATP